MQLKPGSGHIAADGPELSSRPLAQQRQALGAVAKRGLQKCSPPPLLTRLFPMALIFILFPSRCRCSSSMLATRWVFAANASPRLHDCARRQPSPPPSPLRSRCGVRTATSTTMLPSTGTVWSATTTCAAGSSSSPRPPVGLDRPGGVVGRSESPSPTHHPATSHPPPTTRNGAQHEQV